MTDILQTRLNTSPYSATSCSWIIAGAPYVGITALSYEQKRERKLVHGSRRDGTPLGKTAGKYSVGSVTMTMVRSSYDLLTTQLSILGLGSYGDAVFPIIATYSDPFAQLQGVPPIVVMISGASIVGEKEAYAEGFDELLTEVELMALTLTRNNKRLWSVVNAL
jgi:hypothetical protein